MEQYKNQYDQADDHYEQVEFVDAVIRVFVCIAVAAALVFAAGFFCGYAYADPLDRAFERHVEAETKKLCGYEWRLGRETMMPARVMVCPRRKM